MLVVPSPVADRRAKNRYPLALELSYRVAGKPPAGRGRVLNISSSGVIFHCDGAVAIGTQILLTIQWPVLLDDVCPLNLVMAGSVVRSEGTAVAVQVHTHEFRTAGKSLAISAA